MTARPLGGSGSLLGSHAPGSGLALSPSSLFKAGTGAAQTLHSTPPRQDMALSRTLLMPALHLLLLAPAAADRACDPGALGQQMRLSCGTSPPAKPCCEAVVAAVRVAINGNINDVQCFCDAVEASGISVDAVVNLYFRCGGGFSEPIFLLDAACDPNSNLPPPKA
jgi:hypothetical protein